VRGHEPPPGGDNRGVTEAAATTPLTGRTAWARNLETPLRQFLRTETGSAAVLLAATVAALVWANARHGSYDSVWSTQLQVRVGSASIEQTLRDWINTGLMAFFFFIVGLEARREFDMGELRERSRVTVPLAAGVCGMLVPVSIYLAVNAGRSSAHGWGVAMSTDTAFALGMLALVGPRFPDRLRAFMLTVAVVDDLLALVVIAVAYSNGLRWGALFVAAAIFAAILVVRGAGVRYGLVYALLGGATWVALYKSGIDPIVIGLALGLLTYAYPASRTDLERATDLFRLFREQPTPELARSAQVGLTSAISPNERLQQLYHPWTSYVVVPLFALANAGVAISGSFLAHAYASPITLGIVAGYLIGKPIGVTGSVALVSRLTRGRLRPPVGWVAVAGAGTIAGIGFTVSLLIAALAFHGTELLPRRLRIRALFGTAETVVDLADPVDPERDHIRGPMDAPITLVEYGDFECPYCGRAEPIVRELLADSGDVRYVWRHLPLNDVHPNAQLAAEGAEAAARQGKFWEMHDELITSDDLRPSNVVRYAEEIGLDVDRFAQDLREHTAAARVAEDVDSADLSGVSGTPTFFINGKRHYGAYDIGTLKRAVQVARARASLSRL
jgi:Na+/H+ antiporter NhaA